MKKWWIPVVLGAVWMTSLFYAYGLGALAGSYAPQRAAVPMQRAAPLARLLLARSGHRPCDVEDTTTCGFRNSKGRTQVSCAQYLAPGSAVLMTFGQSNSANAGRDRYMPVSDVANYNYHDGKCYVAEDPLLGPDGEGGSVWGVLGDQLIAGGHYQRVLLVPFGISGTELARWTRGGDLHRRVRHTAQRMDESGIRPTHVLWHQGEADTAMGTSTADYFAMFQEMVLALRDYGIEAPVYPAIVSRCFSPTSRPADDTELRRQQVRTAQQRLTAIEGVRPGPDTDLIWGRLYRHDNCHFTHKGMQAHARLWLAALTATASGEAVAGH